MLSIGAEYLPALETLVGVETHPSGKISFQRQALAKDEEQGDVHPETSKKETGT